MTVDQRAWNLLCDIKRAKGEDLLNLQLIIYCIEEERRECADRAEIYLEDYAIKSADGLRAAILGTEPAREGS